MKILPEYYQLKEILIGMDYYNLGESSSLDETEYYNFYKTNHFYYKDSEKIKERNNSIDNLITLLKSKAIKVTTGIFKKRTPFFIGSNVRDIILTLDKTILIFTPYISHRKNEYKNYLNKLKEYETIFVDNLINIDKYKNLPKDKYEYNIHDDISIFKKNYKNFKPCIEAANFYKFDINKIILNISNHSEYHTYILLKPWFEKNNIKIFPVFIDYSHIDGSISFLNKDLFLGSSYLSKEEFLDKLPNEIKIKKLIYLKKEKNNLLCSTEGMDINILSINEKTCIIRKNTFLKKELLKYNIEAIEIDLKYCEYFGGGIHCITTDLKRIK
jgi:N-dimethylarginine dimethylaminohydrolase